jgi:hypothetical protein
MFKINRTLSGYRVLNIDNNTLYAAKGYSIYKSTNKGKSWTLDGKIKDGKYTLIANASRLFSRLLRIEVSDLLVLENGSRILIAKKGIFVAKANSGEYIKTLHISNGKPMNICLDIKKGDLYFGEYISNGYFDHNEREEVHIYTSENDGKDWSICYTFPKNTIRHVHGLFYDKYTSKIWITTGDKGDECLIGTTDDGFKSIEIIKQGGQKYRAVRPLFYKDYIVYGTDTHIEQNYIYYFDRKTGEEKTLKEVQGSVISATQVGNYACIATAIEPSPVNHDKYAHLWFSKDGIHWEEIYSVKKDMYSAKYFQFGRILFPHNAIVEDRLHITGHALKGIDNKTVLFSI